MTRTMSGMRTLAVVLAVLCAVAFMPIFSGQAFAASKFTVSATKATITVGNSITVKASKSVKWSTSKKAVATVSKTKGKSITIKAKKAGSATITAKSGKQSVKIKVTVKAKPKAETKEIIKDNSNKTVNPDGYVQGEDISVTGYYQGDATVYSLLYQESAEVAAMQMQAFSLAKIRVDEALAANPDTPLAIVTDIDSTIADDTCYIAGAVLDAAGRIGVKYFAQELEPWVNDDWCGYYQAVATTADTVLPGAKQFVDYTYENGIEWYYITNRPYYELDLTVQQLQNQGFFEKYDPAKSGLGYTESVVDAFAKVNDYQEYHYGGWYDTDENNAKLDQELAEYAAKINDESTGLEIAAGSFSVKNDYRVQVQGTDFSSDKSARRANVHDFVESKGGKIIMYMGDSINDMVSDGESAIWGENTKDFTRGQLNETRTANAAKQVWAGDWGDGQSVQAGDAYNPGHWGNDFIVLPNATYGDWYKTTWANNKIDGISGKTAEGQQKAIYNQIYNHSYLNTDKFTTWYKGNSPITNDVQ